VKHSSDGLLSCHFSYSRKLFLELVVTKEINHKSWLFSLIQNQAYLNQYSIIIIIGWMANTNIQPLTSLEALLSYIAKYMSKLKKSSDLYLEIQA
jgi:hypothetical protein